MFKLKTLVVSAVIGIALIFTAGLQARDSSDDLLDSTDIQLLNVSAAPELTIIYTNPDIRLEPNQSVTEQVPSKCPENTTPRLMCSVASVEDDPGGCNLNLIELTPQLTDDYQIKLEGMAKGCCGCVGPRPIHATCTLYCIPNS